jgi:hypothetical protein
MNRVAEVELLCQRHKPIGALFDDASASDEIEAGQAEFDGIDADLAQDAKFLF